jgi:hypothetical protein
VRLSCASALQLRGLRRDERRLVRRLIRPALRVVKRREKVEQCIGRRERPPEQADEPLVLAQNPDVLDALPARGNQRRERLQLRVGPEVLHAPGRPEESSRFLVQP